MQKFRTPWQQRHRHRFRNRLKKANQLIRNRIKRFVRHRFRLSAASPQNHRIRSLPLKVVQKMRDERCLSYARLTFEQHHLPIARSQRAESCAQQLKIRLASNKFLLLGSRRALRLPMFLVSQERVQ